LYCEGAIISYSLLFTEDNVNARRGRLETEGNAGGSTKKAE